MNSNKMILSFVVVLAVLFGLAFYGCYIGAWDSNNTQPFSLASAQSRPEPPCMDENTRDQIKVVLLESLDEALKVHVMHTFEVWMKDDRAQPERARNGVVNGINAYLKARKGVLEWLPPQCSG